MYTFILNLYTWFSIESSVNKTVFMSQTIGYPVHILNSNFYAFEICAGGELSLMQRYSKLLSCVPHSAILQKITRQI